jgi:V8-like Glu-specific endopeptidase
MIPAPEVGCGKGRRTRTRAVAVVLTAMVFAATWPGGDQRAWGTARDRNYAEVLSPLRAAAKQTSRRREPSIRSAQDSKQSPPAVPSQAPTAKDFGIKPPPSLRPGAKAPFYKRDVDPEEDLRRKTGAPDPGIKLEPDAKQRLLVIQQNLANPKIQALLEQDRKMRGFVDEELNDLRLPVNRLELRALPFSAIAHIVSEFGATAGREQGTGFLIEPGIALTAAHVLHSPTSGPASRIAFTLGCRVEGIAFGPNPRYSMSIDAARWRIPEAWSEGNFGEEVDYAAIFLPDGHGTEACGHLILDNVQAEFLDKRANYETTTLLVAGFPYDKPYGSLWFARGTLRSVGERVIRHLVDTTRGQSGSPLFAVGLERATGQKIPIVFGIHSRAGFGNFNIARRIDAGLLRDLKRWKSQFGVAGRQ